MPLTSVFFFGIISVWVGAALRLARTMQPEEEEIVTRVGGVLSFLSWLTNSFVVVTLSYIKLLPSTTAPCGTSWVVWRGNF